MSLSPSKYSTGIKILPLLNILQFQEVIKGRHSQKENSTITGVFALRFQHDFPHLLWELYVIAFTNSAIWTSYFTFKTCSNYVNYIKGLPSYHFCFQFSASTMLPSSSMPLLCYHYEQFV